VIKHIVMWKLTAADAAAKQKASKEVEAAFAGLDELVPQIVTLEIVRNVIASDGNWDLALISEFMDEGDLAGYQANEDHKKAAAVIKALASERAAIDYEF
jgi:hypothetical protein